MGPETSVVMQDKLANCQDMTQPVPHYFVKSSHNTYLTGRVRLFDPSLEILVPSSYAILLNRLCICKLTCYFKDNIFGIFGDSLSVAPQLVSSLACPLRRCTDSVCCPAADVWSWTAGRANLRTKSPSSPTASLWRPRSSSRHVNKHKYIIQIRINSAEQAFFSNSIGANFKTIYDLVAGSY